MTISEIPYNENALTAMAHMTFNEFADALAQKIAHLLEAERNVVAPQSPNFLTTEEVAERLGVSSRTLSSLVDQGKVPPPVLGGGQGSKRLWNPRDLDTLRSAS